MTGRPAAGWRPYDEIHPGDNTISGTVVVWPLLEGTERIPAREILAYLPPSLGRLGPEWHASDNGRRYPTIYFHDGQNMFDDATSDFGEWHVDETLELLADEGIEAIAVAVPNAGRARMDEYNPWRSLDTWAGRRRSVGGSGDAYLDWLVGSVKPLVDRSFPTAHGREATGIVGSSMGALISLHALLAHGDTFGLAGVMSPSLHWNDSLSFGRSRRAACQPHASTSTRAVASGAA